VTILICLGISQLVKFRRARLHRSVIAKEAVDAAVVVVAAAMHDVAAAAAMHDAAVVAVRLAGKRVVATARGVLA